ncbi:hypothetical protein Tco_1163815 [Tanacetum coccineum]
MSLVNQDLFYLKYGNSESKIYVPSLHKIHAFLFPEDDLKELNTRWGYMQEYMTEIVVKRADGEYLEFTESNYKYLHKNDIEDMYLMCINGIIKDYRQTKLVKSLTLFIISLIYENNKQEKRVMDIKEIPKFCDATMKRVLEKVKKFNLDVKHGYADLDLRDEDAEYMRFYEEYIQDRLRHREQMRRWESYVNRRPLQFIRERPL